MERFKKDMTPLTSKQMETMKKMIGFCQIFAGQIKDIMVHSHVWHKGFKVQIEIDPSLDYFTEWITVTRKVIDGDAIYTEQIDRMCGKAFDFKEWKTNEFTTTREFIHLFDDEKDGTGKEERKTDEKPLPPNGLWIGSDFNSDYVDCRNAVNRHEEPSK